MIEIMNCPHCGSVAKLYVTECGVCVRCTGAFIENCGCQTEYYDDVCSTHEWSKERYVSAVERAINAWNRRID